jgi:hypothetical protein
VHPTTLELPARAATRPQPPPAPEHGLAHHGVCAWASFNTRAIELRHADDAINMVGATAWVRLAVAVIDGHQPTAVARVAAAADLTSGIGACLPADRYRAVNADLTLHLKRPPAGEWIAIRAHTHIGSHATGTAHAQLYDADGQIGSATQTLVVQAARTS